MLAFAWYLLKVMLCSGMLFGYYWIALRNKKFHHYNRFYLLVSIALSWIIPLMKFDVSTNSSDQPQMIKLLSVVSVGNAYVDGAAHQTGNSFDWNFIAIIAFASISMFLVLELLIGLVKIKLHIRNSIKQKWEDIYLIFSNAKGTPFSFFKYIFWNENIKLNSPGGQLILKHELVHVQEKHSADKLFIGLSLIIGWYNPFLWLIKKELYMIHEFIADEKAIKDGDTAAFASMILNTAYTPNQFSLSNPFFYSPIKRRLFMLTSSKSTRFTYSRRLAILPMLIFTSLLFAFNIKKEKISLSENKLNINSLSLAKIYDIESSNNENSIIDGDTIIKGMAEPLKPMITKIEIKTKDLLGEEHKIKFNKAPNDTTPERLLNKLFVLDGKIMTGKEFEKLGITPDKIKSINVLKGNAVVVLYGEKGREGVIEISTVSTSLEEVVQEQKFDKIFTKVENPAAYKGNLLEYIQANFQYPSEAKMKKTEGKVVIRFIVNEAGNLSDFKPISSIGNGLEMEAIRLLKNSGIWKPAFQNGRKVAFEVKQEIDFKFPQNGTNGFIQSLPKSNLLWKKMSEGC